MEPLVAQIQAEMERRLLTQAEVARMAGISSERVGAVLRRQSRSIPTIRAMRNVLGLGPKEPDATR